MKWDTDVQVGWRPSHDDYCFPSPGYCTQSPSPSSRRRRRLCRWCSSPTQSSTYWLGGELQTCRLSRTVSDSTLCSHSSTPLSSAAATHLPIHSDIVEFINKNWHEGYVQSAKCGQSIKRSPLRVSWAHGRHWSPFHRGLSQTLAEATRPRIRSWCITWHACLLPNFH